MRFPAFLLIITASLAGAQPKPPIRALLVCGGCCHDYAKQAEILRDGIEAKANVQVDVIRADDNGTQPRFEMFERKDWAAHYDVIIHDECAADVKEIDYVRTILDAHKAGLPAVNLHCAMHSYRTGTPDWFEFIGLQSTSHGWQKPIAIDFGVAEHPVTADLENWSTENEELYNNVKVFETAKPLATGTQESSGGGAETAVVAWTNDYHGTRVFGTTLGHNNGTVGDARYLDLVVRGLLWTCDKLNPDYQKPYQGPAGTFVVEPKHVQKAPAPKERPANATSVKVTASSEESDKKNFAWKAMDGDEKTRWCANGGQVPQWLQLEFEKPVSPTKLTILWEKSEVAYGHIVEGSTDGKEWKVLVDAKSGTARGMNEYALEDKELRFLKITCTEAGKAWASIHEVRVEGPGIGPLALEPGGKSNEVAVDRYAKEGNTPPRIEKLSAEKEAEILKDVQVAEGFTATLFANSAAANYPVYVAATPGGDVYVSSDGNGSLGRNPNRGRVLRLRDTDGDHQADEVTQFVKNIDSPRGLIWDHDRLYLLHPPHISAFIDHNGDGQADEVKRLISNIAFGFEDRPADHTTNGLSLGIDGWIYIAVGDFGFMEAEGSDGKKLQMRGGGVVRFRPDGSGMEIFSDGTRNILETPVSPLLDLFARDNTNDGGGWDVRFHHFTGLEDHGYPRLYINFADEVVAPLADYGGGSGCGAVYISEPGFPSEWNNAPFTCDWGNGGLWRHRVQPKGATFEELSRPEHLVKVTRPTDADVDGLSGVYQASWKGATFDWAGPDVGYIVRVAPKGYTPDPLPDFEKESDTSLVALLGSPSQVRSLQAQRALLRRTETPAMKAALLELAADSAKPLEARVAALYTLTQRGLKSASAAAVIDAVVPLASDPSLQRFVLRALGDVGQDRPADEKSPVPVNIFEAGLKSEQSRARLEAIISATRQESREAAPAIATQLGSDDKVLAHTAFRSLAMLGAADAAFNALDHAEANSATRAGALLSLMRIHQSAVVEGLIGRLSKTSDDATRRGILSALCRLHFTEGKWQGDSWGTRPDTRGPYYQPDPWSETPRIGAVLEEVLALAEPEEASFLVAEMSRNRIQSNKALERILVLATEDRRYVHEAVAELASAKEIPVRALPILVSAVSDDADPETLSQAVAILVKSDSEEGWLAALRALVTLDGKPQGADKAKESAAASFLGAHKLENHHQLLEETASRLEEGISRWADAGLLALTARKTGSPESKEVATRDIAEGWKNPERRIQILKAIHATNFQGMNDQVVAAMDDANPDVVKAATEAAKRLKLERRKGDGGPLVSTMKTDAAVKAVTSIKGDVALGEQLFNRQTCVACHTTHEDQAQKGPYLGNIAQTYSREDLALSILEPNHSIAQGFASEVFTLKDGTAHLGFVTLEGAEEVKIRNITADELVLKTTDIVKREKVPTSMMPPGLVSNLTIRDFASLLDYLEGLSKK